MKEPEEVPADERAEQDLLALDSRPPPSASAVESIGEYIAASSFKEGEVEEMSELIPADDSAGRDQLGLDSPPPPSAAVAAFESIGCCEIGARCWEEVEIEVMSLIPADDNAGRHQLELVSPHPHSAAADTEVMALNLEVSEGTTDPGWDHLGLDSSPPAPAVVVEPIGDGIGALSLEEVEIQEMSGRDALGLDTPSPLSDAGEEMLSLNLEESEETTGIPVDVLDSSPFSATVVDESIGGVGASNFVGGEVGDMSELGLESSSPHSVATATVSTVEEMMSLSLEGWQETAKLIFENDVWAEFSSPSSFVSAVESIAEEIGDPSMKEVFELLFVDESVVGDKIGFDTVSEEIGALSLKEGKIEEVSEFIYKSVVHDKLGIDSPPPHSAADAVKSVSKIIRASNLEETGIEENSELIPVNESVEQDKLGIDYLHPPSAVECIREEIRAPSLLEGGIEEMSELIPVNESVEQELVRVDESVNQDKLGFDYSPSLSATDAVEYISEEIRAPSLEGEIEEMSELITVNESVERDKVGIDYSSSPSEATAVECINGEIRATSLKVGEKEEMSELIPVDESVEQDKLELDYSSSPTAAAIVEYIGEEIRTPSLEEGEIEKLSSVASSPAAESISEEIGALGLEEGEIEELSFPTSATAIEFVGQEIGDLNLQNGEIEELSPPFAPATAIEFISEEIGASSLQEGEIEELFAPSAPAPAVESINKEIGAPSLEEGEIEELSPPPAPATAVESIREEIMALSLKEGEIEELSPPVTPPTAADFISEEIVAPSLEGKIEELSPPVLATTVESSNDDIGAPSLVDGEMEELSPPSIPTASVMSTGNGIRALSLEDGEIEELSSQSVGTAAIVSIGKEIRALSLEEGEIEELFDLIPTDESEGQNQPVLNSSPRPSSAIIVTTTTVKEETGSLILEESEETTKPIPVHECAVLDHLGPDLSPLVPAAAVESIAEETGKPCLEEGEIEEMSEPNEEIRGGDGAYLEELEKKFEWDGTGVQENAGWGEDSADPEDSQAFGENLGCSVGSKNLQGSNVEIGWEDNANLEVSEGKFEGDGNHVQESTGWGEAKADFEDSPQFEENGNGYEYPHNTGEYTGWDEPAAIWNPQVESEGVGGACQEGFATFENVGSGQWSEGGGDYGGAPEHGTGWKDSAYEGGFASSENVGGEQWSEGNGDYGIPEHGAGWKDNAYQGDFALSENEGSGQQFESGGDYGGSEHVSAPSDYPQRPGEPDCLYFLRHGYCDYRSRCRFNHPLDRMPDQARPWHRQDSRQEKRFEDVSFRLLCPKDSVGGVIGKGGAIIKALQKEANASINVFPPVEESEERVINVLATESPSLTFSRAQNGVLCVFRRIVEVGIERGVVQGFDAGTSVTARLLVPTNQISSLMDKDGAVITDMGTLSGANIRIIKGDKRPKCASENEEVLQINGELGNVRDALFHVTSKLRENYFPGKTLHGTGMMGAYLSSHDENASDGKVVPDSLGLYPSVGFSHNLESLECQGTLAHNMDLVGLPTSIEQPLSPRVWAAQGSSSGYSYHGQYQKETETGQAELNLLGLPLRPGERECTHYMRTGWCKFSTTCRFHHPDSAVNGQDPSGYWNGGSREQLASGASQLQEAYQASKTSDMSTSLWNASQWAWLFPPKRTHSTSDRNTYQSRAAPNLSGYTSKRDGPTQWQPQMEDYTERKGQPEFPDYQRHWSSASNDPSSQAEMVYAETSDSRPNCPYLLTLGTCKSGSSCKYRHSRVAC